MVKFLSFLSIVWKIIAPFLKAGIILVVGHFLIVYLIKIVEKAFIKANLDISLTRFLKKTINIVLHVIIILSALSAIGISTTGLLAALSAGAVAVALALKDSLGNIAGGILLLIMPRFATGDYIKVAGDEGTVESVDLMHTTLLTIDSRKVIIPNGVLMNSQIINFSCEEKRRVDINFFVSYKSDIEKVKSVILETINSHPLVINEPDVPFARVVSYEESSINIATRSWCKTADYWTVYFDLIEQTKAQFDKNGIEIPYKQIDVNIKEK